MRELCHRCQFELPHPAAGESRLDENALLFCPRCGAPQILLPEHMRVEAPVAESTGAMPPPRPAGSRGGYEGQVDWRVALRSIAVVAGVGVVLSVIGIKSAAVSLLSVLWTISGAVIALGLYARHRPGATMSAKVGTRVGLAAGLLIIATMGIALAVSGVVMRFGTHGMAQFDVEAAQERKAVQTRVLGWMQQQNQDKDFQDKYAAAINSPQMNSPEMQAGSALAGRAMQGFFILLFSVAGGALAGTMRGAQARRPGLRQGD